MRHALIQCIGDRGGTGYFNIEVAGGFSPGEIVFDGAEIAQRLLVVTG